MSEQKITKYDLVDGVYQNTKCERRMVQQVVDNFLEQLKVSLKAGNTIELRGFGTLELRLRKGRSKARNPKTGEQCTVAPHYIVAFRPGQELKKSIWDLPVESSN